VDPAASGAAQADSGCCWSCCSGGLRFAFPNIRTVIADAGHESRKLTRELRRQGGYELRIVKRKRRPFKVIGLTWIVERSFVWLERYRRLSKDPNERVGQP
jgi:hypothetical protein